MKASSPNVSWSLAVKTFTCLDDHRMDQGPNATRRGWSITSWLFVDIQRQKKQTAVKRKWARKSDYLVSSGNMSQHLHLWSIRTLFREQEFQKHEFRLFNKAALRCCYLCVFLIIIIDLSFFLTLTLLTSIIGHGNIQNILWITLTHICCSVDH